MARSKKVSKEALKSIIAEGLRNSAGYYGGELQRRREKYIRKKLNDPDNSFLRTDNRGLL